MSIMAAETAPVDRDRAQGPPIPAFLPWTETRPILWTKGPSRREVTMTLHLRRAGILSGLLAASLVGVPSLQAQRPFGPPPTEPTFPYDPGEPPPVPLD